MGILGWIGCGLITTPGTIILALAPGSDWIVLGVFAGILVLNRMVEDLPVIGMFISLFEAIIPFFGDMILFFLTLSIALRMGVLPIC